MKRTAGQAGIDEPVGNELVGDKPVELGVLRGMAKEGYENQTVFIGDRNPKTRRYIVTPVHFTPEGTIWHTGDPISVRHTNLDHLSDSLGFLTGLKKKPDLNGALCTFGKYIPSTQRHVVHITEFDSKGYPRFVGDELSVKKQNLVDYVIIKKTNTKHDGKIADVE